MDRRYEKSRRSCLSPYAGALSLALSLPIGLACAPYQRRRVSLEGYLGVMERISKKARPFVSKTESHLLPVGTACLSIASLAEGRRFPDGPVGRSPSPAPDMFSPPISHQDSIRFPKSEGHPLSDYCSDPDVCDSRSLESCLSNMQSADE